MNISGQLGYISKHLMGHKEVDGIDVNDACKRGEVALLALEAALHEIAELTSKRQLPLTSQVYDVAVKGLAAVGRDPR